MTAFYDTSSLLLAQERAFDEPFYLSSVTVAELEHTKVSEHKSGELKYQARKLVRMLDERRDMYTVVTDDTAVRAELEKHFMPLSNDNLILASAALTSCDIIYSEDLCMRLIGQQIFGLNMQALPCKEDVAEHTGYKQVIMSDSEYAHFQSNLTSNVYDCRTNEYLICYSDMDADVRDCYRWNGTAYAPAYNKQLKSLTMGDRLKPKDEFQRCAIDSMINLPITAISGKAGSGKSMLALAAAMYLIDSHKYEHLVVLFNPTSTRGAAKMGYYTGSAIEKAKQTSIGHILVSKFGDPIVVDNLLATGQLRLISMADARGCEIADDSILWITEAQNTTPDLLKLCLQRCSAGCKVFLEGDYQAQVDDVMFSGDNNGLKRVIQAFDGDQMFGHVDLPNVWRSRIAELAEKL